MPPDHWHRHYPAYRLGLPAPVITLVNIPDNSDKFKLMDFMTQTLAGVVTSRAVPGTTPCRPSSSSTAAAAHAVPKFSEQYPLQYQHVLARPSRPQCLGGSVQARQVAVLTDVPPGFGYFGVEYCWKCHDLVILPPFFSLLALEYV